MPKKIITSGFANKTLADATARVYRKNIKSNTSKWYKQFQVGKIVVVKAKPRQNYTGKATFYDVVHIK